MLWTCEISKVQSFCGIQRTPALGSFSIECVHIRAANSLTSSQEDEMEEGLKKLSSHANGTSSASPWYVRLPTTTRFTAVHVTVTYDAPYIHPPWSAVLGC
jgi:hypothetical protein